MTNLPYLKGYTKTITTAGTPVQGPDYTIPSGVSVVIKAGSANTGLVTVADSSANAINSSTNNFDLKAGQALSAQIANTNMLWFDSTVSLDTVRLAFEYEAVN